MKVKSETEVAQSCPTLSVLRVVEWIAIDFSKQLSYSCRKYPDSKWALGGAALCRLSLSAGGAAVLLLTED